MTGYDTGSVFYSDSLLQHTVDNDNLANLGLARRKFKDFIREFNERGMNFIYRDQLKKNYIMKIYSIRVNMMHLNVFNSSLTEELTTRPNEYLTMFEEAATDLANELVPEAHELSNGAQCQIILQWDANCINLRDIKSDHVSRMVKLSGIVISASSVKSKATKLSIQCRGCKQFLPNIPVKAGLEGFSLPRKCPSAQVAGTGGGGASCPLDPFFVVPDKCKCIDFQILKLQEAPGSVPHGEMPRHVKLFVDRYLCDASVPGNRVTVVGIYCIKSISAPAKGTSNKTGVGVKVPYLRVLGIQIDNDGPGRSGLISANNSSTLTEKEENILKQLSQRNDIYSLISNSIAPSIYGSEDMKKAIACLLFGGARKRLPDGLCRRGDINMLMLGDPGTAKSQLLKFVERCSPVGVYTSGKGSSAAGLTASVIKDPSSRSFVIEGGAMVLADGGVVCIDEFDKMREDDRVAIHEAMEQQTISIAKAGITTTLNSRCSVLAAANSVYGRWDSTKGESNIDFMPTILSRFDMIFVVRDEHDAHRDTTLARHVIQVHMKGNDDLNPLVQEQNEINDTINEKLLDPNTKEISLACLRKFIAFARESCGPRLSESAATKLSDHYVMLRSGSSKLEQESGKKSSIPITVRQLEAVVRISEALAKMRLAPFASEFDVDEALRLFRVSTLTAASLGTLDHVEGFTTEESHQTMIEIESQLRRRFVIGSQVSEQTLISDFVKQGFGEKLVMRVIHGLIRRGNIQYRMQRRVLYRAQ